MLAAIRYRLIVEHISEGDLLLYCTGLIRSERELKPIEEHLLWCHDCLDRVAEVETALTIGSADLGFSPNAPNALSS